MRLPSGAFESVQSVALPSPVVECSRPGREARRACTGAQFGPSTFGVVRATHECAGGSRFGCSDSGQRCSASVARAGGELDSVSCLYPIRGGVARPRRRRLDHVHADRLDRRRGDLRDQRLLPAPRCAARTAPLERAALPARPGPAPRRAGPAVLRAALAGGRPMKIAVLGATGTVGQRAGAAAGEAARRLAVSRRPRPAAGASAWAAADATDGAAMRKVFDGRRGRLLPRPLARQPRLRSSATASRPRPWPARPSGPACARLVYLGGLGDESPDRSRLTSGAAPRRPASSPPDPCR